MADNKTTVCPACGALPCDQTLDPDILIAQATDALQAMWNHFGDLSDNDMLGMPCKDALVKCRDALAALKEGTHAD